MGDGICTCLTRNLDKALGDQRTGDAGAEQVIAFIAGIGAHHREDEIAHEFFTQVFDIDMVVRNAHQASLVARRFNFFALTQISGKGNNFQSALAHQPFGDDAGI